MEFFVSGWWFLVGTGGQAGTRHAFAKAAFLEEILFEPAELLV